MAEIALSVGLSILDISQLLIQRKSNNSGTNLKSEMKEIKGWLERMKAYMKDNHEGLVNMTNLDAQLIKEIRDIVYHIEDLIDEYAFHSPPYLFHRHRLTKKVHKIAHNIYHDFPHRDIKAKIAEIKDSIEKFNSKNNTIFNNTGPGSSSQVGTAHNVSPLPHNEELLVDYVGYEKPIMDFICRLKDGEKKLLTLAVDGPCGSGKTRFVENALIRNREFLGQFDCHAWVHVSLNFTTETLFSDMLKKLYQSSQEPYPDNEGRSTTASDLRNYLAGRRYIVVIDNICRKEHWDEIKYAFLSTNRGSRVIVTTRSIDVSSACASPNNRFSLNGLDWPDGWNLFVGKAFPNSNGVVPTELNDCAEKIVKRCEGLPLAIATVGEELSLKPGVPNEWEDFHKNLENNIGGRSAISKTLLPSYLDLSSDLQCCFLYFSIFPEDYNVKYKRLIRLWVAERFVVDEGQRKAEEVAREYLDELIHRNLVHVTNRDFDGRPRNCRILNPFLNFIIKKRENENFASIFPREDTRQSQMIRRLSVHGDWKHMPKNNDFAIRSLFLSRCPKDSPTEIWQNFRLFKLLRILDFEGAPVKEFAEEVTQSRSSKVY